MNILFWLLALYVSSLNNPVSSRPILWQKRANELALRIDTMTGNWNTVSSSNIESNSNKFGGTNGSRNWPAELPKGFSSKQFTLPPIQYEEDKKSLFQNLKSSRIKESIEKQRKKPQRVQSFAQGRVEDAKWEKLYFSATTGAAFIAKKVYDSSKSVAKTAKEKCLIACESFKKSASFTESSREQQSLIKYNKESNLNKGQRFNKSQSLNKRRKRVGSIRKRDVILVRRANSESQESRKELEKDLKKEKGKRFANDSFEKSSNKQLAKKRRKDAGIRIGSEQQQPPHNRPRRSTISILRKTNKLRIRTNRRRTRLLRTILAQPHPQPQNEPVRVVRQATLSNQQSEHSQIAYQSDSSVSSALSNREDQNVLRQLNIHDQRHHRDHSIGSGSGTSSASIEP